MYYCGQLDRHELSKDHGPGTEGHRDGKPQVSSSGQSIVGQDLAPSVTFPPLAYHGHEVWTLTSPS